jgi:hypothetical protein
VNIAINLDGTMIATWEVVKKMMAGFSNDPGFDITAYDLYDQANLSNRQRAMTYRLYSDDIVINSGDILVGKGDIDALRKGKYYTNSVYIITSRGMEHYEGTCRLCTEMWGIVPLLVPRGIPAAGNVTGSKKMEWYDRLNIDIVIDDCWEDVRCCGLSKRWGIVLARPYNEKHTSEMLEYKSVSLVPGWPFVFSKINQIENEIYETRRRGDDKGVPSLRER